MKLANELIQYYRWLREYGLNDSHSGNASVRDGEKIWITPTGASADILQVSDLISCRLDQPIPHGASLDAALHFAVYRKNTLTQAVLHSHGAYSIAMTFSGESFQPIDFEGCYYFSSIPVLEIAYQDYIQDSPEKVSNVLATQPLVIVRGHGVYAQASSLNLAYKWTCSLESSAKTAWLTKMIGHVK
jgi:L-fuculose-phosphate aldolase